MWIALFTAGVLVLASTTRVAERKLEPATIVQVSIDDQAITPITARHIARAVQKAEKTNARYLLIEIDTPGGLLQSTREIVRTLIGSKVEVVVYVSPSGARAASAGLFIALAADIVAMAPGTHIGAAHPVSIGDLPVAPDEQKKETSAISEKVANDTQAWARALAELRGRNVEIAERGVSESLSLTASEAAESGLIDFVAADRGALLARLNATDLEINPVEMTRGERFLGTLANPNLAFLLLIIGFYGLMLEFYTPGLGAAGVLGFVSILFGLVGLAVLPLNYAGLALLALGLAMFVAEGFVVSFGLLTVGGVACVVLGGLMLVDSPSGFLRVSLAVVLAAALATAAITTFLVGSAVKAHRLAVATGAEALLRERAIAREAFHRDDAHYAGTVLAHGELWTAVSSAPVAAEQELEITNRDGLTLMVRPAEPSRDEKGERS